MSCTYLAQHELERITVVTVTITVTVTVTVTIIDASSLTQCKWWQVAGILTGDAELVGQSLDSDVIIEPVRGPLIPGFAAVKAAAKAAGMAKLLFV